MFRHVSQRQKMFGVASALALIIIGSVVYMLFFKHRTPDDVPTFGDAYDLVLQNYDGENVRLTEFKGQILVIYSWASWCPYCGDELKNLAMLKEKYGDRIHIVAINRAEPLAVAREFTDAIQLSQALVFLLDPNDSYYKKIEGYAMPETVFINNYGEVLFHQHGPMQLPEVIERIDQIIGK